MQSITQILASELGQPVQYVENVIALLDEGSTIPFIARYRKEQHGSMDDTCLLYTSPSPSPPSTGRAS